MALELRLVGDLAELVGAARRSVEIAERRSCKDVVESVGVPHTEVGALRLAGRAVTLAQTLEAGERGPLEVRSSLAASELVPAPPRPLRLVCDVHLGALARRLRLLGLDTRYARDADDAWLADVAAAERRVLCSRDRGLLSRRAVVHGMLPRSDDPDRQVREVAARFPVARDAAPHTRCVRCNGLLRAAAREEVAEEVPPRSLAAFDRFARCGDCGQVFWSGSHVEATADLVAELTDRGPAAG